MGVDAARQVIGRYTIYDKIASGGMASVHFGRLLGGAGFSRTVAIKRLHPHLAEDPEFLSTMIDEARLAARIHHPNVVPTLDVVAAEGELLLVMEYVRGESLARLIKVEAARQARIPLPVASAIAIGALQGLHAAHEAKSDHGAPLGIVHRDVSPQNILVGIDGLARVIDFGVAKAAGRLQTTREGTLKGKIAYMAPEQVGAREVTRSADVYAMGVVIWEMLTGKRLFKGDNDVALLALVLAGPTDPPSRYAPDLPAEVDDIVMKALARDPGARFATALEMAERLLRVVPPAFSTDVGTWCESAAHESLTKRGMLLAGIEGHSGISVLPRPPGTHGAATGNLAVASGGRSAVSGIVGNEMTLLDDDAPILATQPSSLSVETPKPSAAPRTHSRRAALTATFGAGAALLLVGFVAISRFTGTPPAPRPFRASTRRMGAMTGRRERCRPPKDLPRRPMCLRT